MSRIIDLTNRPTSAFGVAGGPGPSSDSHPARQGRARLAMVEAYWSARSRNGRPPRRGDIDPRGIETALPNAFVLERITPGEARIRVAGHQINDLLGMEPRGMPFSALIEPAGRGVMQDVLAHLFDDPALCRLSLQAETGLGRPALSAELLLLPLLDDQDRITRALGCLVATGKIGRTPRRLAIAETRIQPLPDQSLAQTGVAQASAAQASAAQASAAQGASAERGLDEAPAHFIHAQPARAHLRLVKND